MFYNQVKKFSFSATKSSGNKTRPQPKFKEANFINQSKTDARRIARNPERFLENFVNGKQELYDSGDAKALESFVQNFQTKSDHDFRQKMAFFNQGKKNSRDRTFLINMGSCTSLKSESLTEFLENGGASETSSECSQIQDCVDPIVKNLLKDIKNADLENILTWISM